VGEPARNEPQVDLDPMPFIIPESPDVLATLPPCPFELDDHQKAVVNWREGEAAAAAAAGCHCKGQGILMFDGSIKNVEDVVVGDSLMGPDSEPRHVEQLIRGHGKMARIVPVKGEPFVVNLDHVLSVELSTNAKRKDHKQIVDLTVHDHLSRGSTWQTRAKLFRRPVCSFGCEQFLPIDAYFLGMLLGDGSLIDRVSISKPGDFVKKLVEEQAAHWGLSVRVHNEDGSSPTYVLTSGRGGVSVGRNPLINELRELGLFGIRGKEKFIPHDFKCASRPNRAALLAGLLDSDGCLDAGGCGSFINISRQLSEDFAFVCRSLGLAAYITETQKADQNGTVGTYWRVSVSGDMTMLPLRRLKPEPRRQVKDVLCTGFDVERLDATEDFYGFTLDGDGRYLLSDFTVTHNSGKSTVLVERTAALIKEGVLPESIITLVYNKKAAVELKQRLEMRVGTVYASRTGVFTFHGFSFTQMQKWFPGQFGKGRLVGVEDGPSAKMLGLKVMRELKLDGEVGDLLKVSELAREALIDVEAKDAGDAFGKLSPLEDASPKTVGEAVAFARGYQRIKAMGGMIDFADMLSFACRVIQRNGLRAQALAGRYKHIQVDEAQDINPARLYIAQHLAKEAKSLVMVGDLRQSIYGFTGARPDLFRSRIDHHGATLLTLPVNRRSTAPIVAAGNAVAAGRDWNLGGACSPSSTNAAQQAEPVHVWFTKNAVEEADAIVHEIQARVDDGLPLATDTGKSNYACLVRTNAQAATLEVSFLVRKLPVRIVGQKGGVWMTNPGRDFFAYLRGAAGIPHDDVVRIANKPARYLRRVVVEDAIAAASNADNGVDLHAALRGSLDRKALSFAFDLEGLAQLDWNARVDRVLELLLRDVKERSGGLGGVDSPDEDREEALKALADAARTLGGVEGIQTQIDRMNAVDDRTPAAEICTMHKSKGAEWQVVFTCGAHVDSIPHKKAAEKNIEEERRLFYVAITRAQKVAVVSIGGEETSPFVRAILPVAEVSHTGDDDDSEEKIERDYQALQQREEDQQ
jgi:superfamily I DNA/RNA helicase